MLGYCTPVLYLLRGCDRGGVLYSIPYSYILERLVVYIVQNISLAVLLSPYMHINFGDYVEDRQTSKFNSLPNFLAVRISQTIH